MAATKFHFDGPKALPLEFARTLAGPGPRFAERRSRRKCSAKRAFQPRLKFYCFLNNIIFEALNVYFAALKAATKGSPWMGPSFTWMDQRLCLWNPPGPSRALDPDLPKFVPARRSSAGDAFRPRGEEIGQRLTVTHPIFRASIGRTEDCESREQSHAFGAGDTAASGSGSRAREGPGPSK